MPTGICTNLGNCSKADADEKIEIPVGGQFVCPECGRELSRIGGPARFGRSPVIPLLLVLLVLGGLTFGAYKLFFGQKGNSPAPGPNAEIPTAPSSESVPEGTQTILRLSGSSIVGSKLAPALAEAFLTTQRAADVKRIASDKDEVTIVGTLPGQSAPSAIEIKAHGDKTAFEDLAAGKADIGMASRAIKPEEETALASFGDMTSRASENVLGVDGLAIIVNQANSLEALTQDQARDIFTGQVTDWSQVGGSPGAIQLYTRDDKSGTFDTFKDLVLRGAGLASSAKRFQDSTELSNSVASDVNGIGFVGVPYILNTKALKVSAEGSVPIRPSVLTVRTEDYLLSRRLYLYTPPVPKNPWVRKFIDFALANDGQRIVDNTGFVGQAITPNVIHGSDVAVVATNLPPAYQRLIQGAERLPFNFRFRTGSDELDTKAYRDLGRLLQYMSDQGGRQVLLLGFADSVGSTESNLGLSRRRAHSVEGELVGEGIRPAVVEGFGEELPVAGNDTEEGREKNRRVEVWVRR